MCDTSFAKKLVLRSRRCLRVTSRAAGSVPDYDAVLVSLEPGRTGLLFAPVIHGRLRPRVAEPEAPVGIWQLRDPCARPRQRIPIDKTEASQVFGPELRQSFIQHCLGQPQETRGVLGPMRLRDGVLDAAAVVQSKRGMATSSAHGAA